MCKIKILPFTLHLWFICSVMLSKEWWHDMKPDIFRIMGKYYNKLPRWNVQSTVIVFLFLCISIFKQTKSGFTWKWATAHPHNWIRERGFPLEGVFSHLNSPAFTFNYKTWVKKEWDINHTTMDLTDTATVIQYSTCSKQAVFCFSNVMLWNLCLIFSFMFVPWHSAQFTL